MQLLDPSASCKEGVSTARLSHLLRHQKYSFHVKNAKTFSEMGGAMNAAGEVSEDAAPPSEFFKNILDSIKHGAATCGQRKSRSWERIASARLTSSGRCKLNLDDAISCQSRGMSPRVVYISGGKAARLD